MICLVLWVGGKVAIDFEGYKNLVGAFYPPKAVVIDCNTLETLNKRQISNGLAESVKMAMTCDKELFEYFEKDQLDFEYIIEKSLMIKRFVVQEDEKETGLRKILNFGHTLAHAIETNSDFKDIYHGEAVALGMIPMCSKDVRPRLIKVLKGLNLPTEFDFNNPKIFEAVFHDKKADGMDVTVVYVEEIGKWKMKKVAIEEFIRGVK